MQSLVHSVVNVYGVRERGVSLIPWEDISDIQGRFVRVRSYG
jgi:hypothetical protein